MGQIVKIFERFLSQEDHKELHDYAMMIYTNGLMSNNIRGPFRKYICLDKDYNQRFFSKKVQQLYNTIANIIPINNPEIDPSLGILLSVIEPGGFVHKHNDPYKERYELEQRKKVNLRFNIMVNRGDSDAYNPLIESRLYDVKVRDAWLFNATDFYHSTNVIPGPELRVVYQFGFIVDRNILQSIDIDQRFVV